MSYRSVLPSVLTCFACLLLPSVIPADDTQTPNPPQIAEASNEGELAIQGFRVPEGMKAELFAAEPMLANPVAFAIDERGRFYVCETFRQSKGVEDNRGHMHWLHDDLAAQTVGDRLAYFTKHLGEKVREYTREDDRIRLIEDTDGDGKADKATVFADGFNGILEGTGAGVLARDGNVWYTNIPNLWLLRDEDGDGKADSRESLHYGYGVRVAFRGHDLHGLTMGPDGRLYFSVGDRGFNVEIVEREAGGLGHEAKEVRRRLAMPDTGAVFRCEPDGSNLEVFAYGLRNPQELAFDDYGNLFTGDNNSDSGDRARWVHVVEGSDSGWRMYYQYLDDRGPWNREMMWYPHDAPPLERPGPGGVPAGSVARDVQPAYIVPPVANFADGPSGLTYYPGVGLPERYRGHFFMADFRGTAGNSGVRSFAVKPKGASFELVDAHEFVWSILATDVDFGYDGGLYVSDWVNGWEGEGKGRIYRFRDPRYKEAAAESAELMREGFEHRSADELAKLLGHPDRRVRLEAQFALVEQGAGDALERVAKQSDHQLARLHAIWGLGQIARAPFKYRYRRNRVADRTSDQNRATDVLLTVLDDADDQVRAQAARALGEAMLVPEPFGSHFNARARRIGDALISRLKDDSPRVQLSATIALGTGWIRAAGEREAISALFALLEKNADKDPVLRHAAITALAAVADPNALIAASKHASRSVRLGATVALRRLESPEIAVFLNDSDSAVVLEAARAINDVPIDGATAQLAALAGRPGTPDALLRRVLNANFRLGQREHAEAVAAVAADAGVSEALRLDALAELQIWGDPPPLDRVTGAWRPLEARSAGFMADVIRPHLGAILSGPDEMRKAGVRLAAKYGIREVAPVLFELATDGARDGGVRVEALRALDALQADRVAEAAHLAVDAGDARVRAEGRRLLARVEPEKAVESLRQALESGETVERQGAVAVLTELKSPAADALLAEWLDRLVARDVPPEIQLDLIEAARERGTPELVRKLEAFEATRSTGDHLAKFREALAGGDAARGEQIFFGRSDASCRRCHKVEGNGGEVGPDLSGIGLEKDREYLLESLVDPSRAIAKGYESVTLALASGKILVGMIRAEDEKSVRLMTGEGETIIVPKEEIDARAAGKSAMPADLIEHLTKMDIRDLVEYLSTRRTPASESEHR